MATERTADRRRGLILAVACAGMFFVFLDVTIVNVALPALRYDLGLGPSGLQWVVDADTLCFGCGMLSAGKLGDMTGRKRLLLIGLALVGLGSAVCGLATGVVPLLAGRAVQGLGGALLLPQSLAILSSAYPEPDEQARAIGLWSGISALALPLGPLVGGALVDRFGWPSIFWVNVPMMAAALALGAWVVPEEAPARGRRLDLVGQALVTSGIALVVGGLVTASDQGWAAVPVVGLLALGGSALAGFVVWERRAPDPMLPRSLAARPGFGPVNAVGMLMAFGGVGVLYLVALLLQVAQGRSALATGLLLLPATVPLAVGAPLCAGLARRVGWRPPMVLGMATAAVSGLLLLAVGRSAPPLVVGVVLLTLGIGLTLNTAPMVAAAMSIAPAASRSLASAANNTARQIGAALGIAVMGTLAGNPSSAAFTPGLHHAALAATAAWAAAAVLATRAPPAAAGPQRQVGQRRWSQPRTVVGSEGHNVASS